MTADLCAPWATTNDLTGCDCGTEDPDKLAAAIEDASFYLYCVSGFRWPGVCDDGVARPNARSRWVLGCAPEWWIWDPSWGACGCPTFASCGCAPLRGVGLGRSPIVTVETVTLDGDLLVADTDYTLSDDWLLVRTADPDTGDRRFWPRCQRLDLPPTEPDTFEVTFTWGAAPPSLGVTAARDLACVLARAGCGDEGCKPAEKIVSENRQGTTLQFISPADDIGRDMPQSVRMFIEAVNPGDYRSPPVIRRPQVTRPWWADR